MSTCKTELWPLKPCGPFGACVNETCECYFGFDTGGYQVFDEELCDNHDGVLRSLWTAVFVCNICFVLVFWGRLLRSLETTVKIRGGKVALQIIKRSIPIAIFQLMLLITTIHYLFSENQPQFLLSPVFTGLLLGTSQISFLSVVQIIRNYIQFLEKVSEEHISTEWIPKFVFLLFCLSMCFLFVVAYGNSTQFRVV